MNRLVIAFALFFMCAGFSAAQADTNVAFPPDNCDAISPFMSFNGPVNGNNTYCSNGQAIFNNALLNPTNNPNGCAVGTELAFDGTRFYCRSIPTCASTQKLAFDGSSFHCEDVLPTCAANQYPTFNGQAYECKNLPPQPGNCDPGYALAYTNGGFSCVKTGVDVPTCNGTNQFLVYNGGFSCANVVQPTQVAIPTCGANQVVKANGSSFYCDTPPYTGGASCTTYVSNGAEFLSQGSAVASGGVHSTKSYPHGAGVSTWWWWGDGVSSSCIQQPGTGGCTLYTCVNGGWTPAASWSAFPTSDPAPGAGGGGGG